MFNMSICDPKFKASWDKSELSNQRVMSQILQVGIQRKG